MAAAYQEYPQFARDFLFYMETVRGRSPKTVAAYAQDLKTFFRFLLLHFNLVDESVSFSDIPIDGVSLDLIRKATVSDLYEFLHYTASQRSNSPAARSRKTSCLRTFYKYLSNQQLIQSNPTEKLELPSPKKALPKYLQLEESLELLQAVSGKYPLRDYCMIVLFLNCGMRLSELVGLNLSDLKINRERPEDSTVLLRGKGNKERVVYLNAACLDAIQQYLPQRSQIASQAKHFDKQALFLSFQGNRICNRQVERIVNQAFQKAGLAEKGYTVHKLRHTAATLMYRYTDADIRVLQEILGHSSLSTTQIYTHVSNQQVQKTMDASPLANVRGSGNGKKAAKQDAQSSFSEDDSGVALADSNDKND